MKKDLKKAAELLHSGGYTCVLCQGGVVYTSTKRGVKPLLAHLDSNTDLHGFCAADKVVGKAAAFLYVLLGVTEVYAQVISDAAKETFARYHIQLVYDTAVPRIANRAGTGFCPMEQAVWEIDQPEQAANAIRAALQRLSQGEPAKT